MKTPAPADLHRWSEELARNPASLAFLPLARAYRRMSRRDLAMQLCHRGLEHHPTHVEAHALLALLYFEAGERASAADEWATVLRLKPGNFEALRGMGFRHLEQGDLVKARQHLERAALIRPDDSTVQEALRLIRQRESATTRSSSAADRRSAAGATAAEPGRPPSAQPLVPREPPRSGPQRPSAGGLPETVPTGQETQRRESRTTGARETAAPRPAPRFQPAWPNEPETRPAARLPDRSPGGLPAEPPPDPTRLFDSLMASGPLLGVLLMDRRGLVLAGGLKGQDTMTAEELGANLGGAIDEATRAVLHLDLGDWSGLTLEAENAVLQIRPVGGDALVVIAAERSAPGGWVVRAADRAATIAERFVEVYS